jgi:ganglioside GM2 activator
VLLERKVGPFFVKVPCVDNFGSCNYGNVCDLWAEFCPKYAAEYGLPCQCPIPADTYSVSNANIFIAKNLPPELLGEYRTTVDIGSRSGHLGCINIDLSIKN